MLVLSKITFYSLIIGLDQYYMDIFNDPNIDGFCLRRGKSVHCESVHLHKTVQIFYCDYAYFFAVL